MWSWLGDLRIPDLSTFMRTSRGSFLLVLHIPAVPVRVDSRWLALRGNETEDNIRCFRALFLGFSCCTIMFFFPVSKANCSLTGPECHRGMVKLSEPIVTIDGYIITWGDFRDCHSHTATTTPIAISHPTHPSKLRLPRLQMSVHLAVQMISPMSAINIVLDNRQTVDLINKYD